MHAQYYRCVGTFAAILGGVNIRYCPSVGLDWPARRMRNSFWQTNRRSLDRCKREALQVLRFWCESRDWQLGRPAQCQLQFVSGFLAALRSLPGNRRHSTKAGKPLIECPSALMSTESVGYYPTLFESCLQSGKPVRCGNWNSACPPPIQSRNRHPAP